jgi:heme/copper-type cytochrome/quinol oxidase subunit 2
MEFALFIIFTFAVLALILWISAIIDIVRSEFVQCNNQLAFLLIVIFFPVAGSIIYFLMKGRLVVHDRNFNPDFNRR